MRLFAIYSRSFQMREESLFRQLHEDRRQGSEVLDSSLFYVYNVHIPVTKTK